MTTNGTDPCATPRDGEDDTLSQFRDPASASPPPTYGPAVAGSPARAVSLPMSDGEAGESVAGDSEAGDGVAGAAPAFAPGAYQAGQGAAGGMASTNPYAPGASTPGPYPPQPAGWPQYGAPAAGTQPAAPQPYGLPQPYGVPQPQPYPGPYLAPAPRTDGVSIAALVTGIVGLITMIPLVPLVLGIVGVTRTGPGKAAGRGMAIAGIVMGAITIAIWVLLIVAFWAMFSAVGEQVGDPGSYRALASVIVPLA